MNDEIIQKRLANIFFDGLINPAVQKLLLSRNVCRLADAVELASREINIQRELDIRRAGINARAHMFASAGEVTSLTHKEQVQLISNGDTRTPYKQHSQSKRRPSKFGKHRSQCVCYSCGLKGNVAHICKVKHSSSIRHGYGNSNGNRTASRGSTLCEIRVAEIKLTALIDTGSECTLLNENIWVKLPAYVKASASFVAQWMTHYNQLGASDYRSQVTRPCHLIWAELEL